MGGAAILPGAWGYSLVPCLAVADVSTVSAWNDVEVNHVRRYIESSSADMITFAVLLSAFAAYSSLASMSSPNDDGKRTGSDLGLPQPAPKRVKPNAVPRDETMNVILAKLEDLQAQLDRRPPANELNARLAMYTAKAPAVELKTNKSCLARDRVQQWISGKSLIFPKISMIHKAMNTEQAFDGGSLKDIRNALIFLLRELSTSTSRLNTAWRVAKCADISKTLTELNNFDNGSSQAATTFLKTNLQSWANEVNQEGNFVTALSILRVASIVLPTVGVSVRPKVSSSPSITTTARVSKPASARLCHHCKSPSHIYNDCALRKSGGKFPDNTICKRYNTREGCSVTRSRDCSRIHRCSKCQGPHRLYECTHE